MHLQLKPELQKFIDDQVTAGHFTSAGEAIEAAIEQMMRASEDDDLDDAAAAAINRAEEQLDRGEGIDSHQFAAEMRKNMGRNLQSPQLTKEDIDAIKESDAQFERGEVVDFREFAAEMLKKYGDGNSSR